MKSLLCFHGFIPNEPIGELKFLNYFNLIRDRFQLSDVIMAIDLSSLSHHNEKLINSLSVKPEFKKLFNINKSLLFKNQKGGEAPSYQSILKYLKDNISILDNYDLIYFSHTHCITHYPFWNYLGGLECLKNMIFKPNIEPIFENHPEIGFYGFSMDIESEAANGFDFLDEYCNFPFKAIEWYGLRTMGCIRSSIIKSFLLNLKNDKLFKNLEEQGQGRYFFEYHLSSIASKFGYLDLHSFIERPGNLSKNESFEIVQKKYDKYISQSPILQEKFKNFDLKTILTRYSFLKEK